MPMLGLGRAVGVGQLGWGVLDCVARAASSFSDRLEGNRPGSVQAVKSVASKNATPNTICTR